MPVGKLTSFPKAVKLQDGEIVVFSWIIYKSRADRDAVMKKVMADPRWKRDVDMPFDGKRMIFGGFKPIRGNVTTSRRPFVNRRLARAKAGHPASDFRRRRSMVLGTLTPDSRG